MLSLPSLETHFGKEPILNLCRQWTSPTTLDLPYVFLSQSFKSKFTLYTTHVCHTHCGFTTTVQGMTYYSRDHDTFSKP